MDVDGYLQRTGFTDTPRTDIQTLRKLHLAHMLAAPFENFDIHLGNTITLHQSTFYQKIAEHRRVDFVMS